MLGHNDAVAIETTPFVQNWEDPNLSRPCLDGDDRDIWEESPSSSSGARSGSGRSHLYIGNDFDSSSMARLPQRWRRWLFPPDVPRSLQLFRCENAVVPACYLVVGLMQGLSKPLMNVYPLDLGATEAQQVTLATLPTLPCTLKILFGFLSDNVPVFGYRRKCYMAIGWFASTFSMIVLMLSSDLAMKRTVTKVSDASTHVELLPPQDAPSVSLLGLCFLMFGTGLWFADVMADSIVAEKARLEPEYSRGHLQSTCYACRFFGIMVAAPLSTVCYSKFGPFTVVALLAAIPMTIQPLIYFFREERNAIKHSALENCLEIWNTVCSRAVWQPLGFVWIYNILQVSNGAWRQFLKSVLGFSSNQINALLIASYVLLYLGTLAYKYYFIRWSWRKVYLVGILINGFFSALQILLIFGITFGLSPFLFALGDDAFSEFIVGIQFLPITIMFVHLCPDGSEGASYALFTSVHNAALLLAPAISTTMLSIWDVSKETMESGDLSGMVKLTCLTSLIQLSAVLFVQLLPENKNDLDSLHKSESSRSRIGGFIVLATVFVSIAYSVVVGILNIIKPGWTGES